MEDLKLAVLIDADNISPKYVKVILDEAASFGIAAVKRIYGDWSDPRLKSWRDVLLNNSIIPMQQYSYTSGKNATDSAMIIDAMDLLYAGNLGGFCIVSSDSDFTRLAARLREAGKLVIGMGESKTLGPFVKACPALTWTPLATQGTEKGYDVNVFSSSSFLIVKICLLPSSRTSMTSPRIVVIKARSLLLGFLASSNSVTRGRPVVMSFWPATPPVWKFFKVS